MNLIIYNQESTQKSYLSGAAIVPANDSLTVPIYQIFSIARDAQLIADCYSVSVTLSDGVNDYRLYEAVRYLDTIAAALGGQVVGYTGSPAPSFNITVGGKDPNGNSQPGRLNQFNDLSINYRNKYLNVTGNTTITAKSGSGTLHAIMVNRNWTGGTVVVYDNTVGSGTIISTADFGTPAGGLLSTSGLPGPILLGPLGLEFTIGLTVVTSGSTSNNITLIYQ